MKDSGLPYIGVIPAQWNLFRLKAFFTPSAITNKRDARVLSLYRDYGVIPKDSRDDNHNVTSLDTSKYKYVNRGDFVINKMKAWQGSMALSGYDGIVSPAYHVFKFRSEGLWPRYAHYLLRCSSLSNLWRGLSTGLRVGQWDLHVNDFLNTYIPLPPLNEQRRIADYLDAKCTEVDTAISHAEALISEYELYEQALITHTVNSGVNADAEMVPSGNAFIGNKPASWPLVRFKHVAFFLNGDRSARYPSGDDIVSDGIPFVTSTELNGRHLSHTFSKHITQMKYDCLGGVRLHIDDVVYCLRGSVGRCALNVQEDEGTVASSLTVARPKGCDPSWLNYALASSSTLNQAVATAIGATSQNLAANMLAQAQVPLPSLDNQLLIANRLDSKCDAIDQAIAQKQSIIDDLKAYKQSLIYEVVTGKREV